MWLVNVTTIHATYMHTFSYLHGTDDSQGEKTRGTILESLCDLTEIYSKITHVWFFNVRSRDDLTEDF